MTADGSAADERAVTNPAHWAVLLYEDTALCDVDTGELVDEGRRWTGIPRISQTPNPQKGCATLKRSPKPWYSPPSTTASTTAQRVWRPGTWFARRAGPG